MIEKIKINSVNTSSKSQPQKQPQFKGRIVDAFVSGIQQCEKNPMINVSVLDVTTAIGPRSVYDGVMTNIYAGLETLRRESSGLIVNCLIPSVVVLGIGKSFAKPIMGRDTKMGSCWANEETIKTISKYWEKAGKEISLSSLKPGTPEYDNAVDKKLEHTIRNLLSDIHGADGDKLKAFKDFEKHEKFEESVKALIKSVKDNDTKAGSESAYNTLVKITNASEHIKIGGKDEEYFSQTLGSIFRDTPKVLKEFVENKIHDTNAIETFVQKSKKLITTKSLLGLGIIIPLAISMQPINRWITKKSSGKDGAPIYKDFAESQTKELTSKEKKELFGQKLISVGAMLGVSLLSVMKKPNMAMLKEITQFKGIFPTMDQARLISTATFASRMMASQDKNDLRESTVRDIATFSFLYFLGDYVAKGIATAIEKRNPEMKLINVLKPKKKDANIIEKFGHWVKNTAIKSSDELMHNTKAMNARTWCQIGNIAFSLVALSVPIIIGRNKTNKQREKELKQMGVDKSIINKYYPHFMKNNASSNLKGNVYEAFFTSK